jgi:hypothetical protein
MPGRSVTLRISRSTEGFILAARAASFQFMAFFFQAVR